MLGATLPAYVPDLSMPRITKNLHTDQILYHFSGELVWACRYHAKIAISTNQLIALRAANIASIFAAGSYVEARINEIAAEVANIGADDEKADFWKLLHEIRGELDFRKKWNLIASLYRGKKWDSAKEPFHSYDLIVSLRNELVHYKGDFGEDNNPRTKKIKGLRHKLKIKNTENGSAHNETFWIDSFLHSRKLALFIEKSITEFDMKFEHLLTGKEFSKNDMTIYSLKQASYELMTN